MPLFDEGVLGDWETILKRVAETVDAGRTADLAGDGGRINLGLTTPEWELVLAALRSAGTGRAEAEAPMADEGVRPPGEALWQAHGAVFGLVVGTWDDLALIDKLRWASVEDTAIRALPTQPAGGARGE